mgnify:CR=1 FL=1
MRVFLLLHPQKQCFVSKKFKFGNYKTEVLQQRHRSVVTMKLHSYIGNSAVKNLPMLGQKKREANS